MVSLMHLVTEICLDLAVFCFCGKAEFSTDNSTVYEELGADIDRVTLIAVAPDECLRDTLDLGKNSFDLFRESLLAVRKNDHGLNTARDVDGTGLIDKAHITCVEPSVSVDCFLCSLFILVIAEHDAVRL